jgi:phage-related protein
VTQFLKSALEANRGCTASDIVLRIVHVDNLAEDYAELTINYDIVYPRITAKFVEFKLGSPSPLKRRVPTDRFYSDSCRFIFKDARCGYTGAETSCSRIRGRCRELNNEERFGGFPGLRAETIRLA